MMSPKSGDLVINDKCKKKDVDFNITGRDLVIKS